MRKLNEIGRKIRGLFKNLLPTKYVMNTNLEEVKSLISTLKRLQDEFYKLFKLKDIYSSSKIFEILIADYFGHDMISKSSGHRDAKGLSGEYEYKHYKETSCNHTWTFNDFSDATIKHLSSVVNIIFAHIDDTGDAPLFDWYYEVPGAVISKYLQKKTVAIKNARKMINVSPSQIEKELGINKTHCTKKSAGKYDYFIRNIFETTKQIEKIIGTKNILTSNKIWEILVGLELDHTILSEQKQFDAVDKKGDYYEYKVSQTYSFNFEDISENVLSKFKQIKKVILAIVDKENMKIVAIFAADPSDVTKRLREKLREKERRFAVKGKKVRRLQVTLSKGDLRTIATKKIL